MMYDADVKGAAEGTPLVCRTAARYICQMPEKIRQLAT
jgi:hypothetical protein